MKNSNYVEPIKLTKFLKNELCPCGSGKKYKSCCFNAKDNKSNINEKNLNNDGYINHCIMNMYKKTDFKTCIYPDNSKCKGGIINAHTLQNNYVLSQLSVDEHVIVSVPVVDKFGVKIEFKRISKNKATTFMGFCKEHDDKIFAPIEKKCYTGEKQQNFLFAYRAFAQEYHKKMRMMTSLKNIVKNKPSLTKIEDFVANYRLRELDIFDIKEYKKIFDKSLIEENYDILESITFKLDKQYDFAVTTMFTLSTDIEGNCLNDIYSYAFVRMKSCFITIIPLGGETLILLSWLKEDSSIFEEYKKQLNNLTEDQLKIYINNLIPMYTENIVLSPRLWEKLTPYSRKELEKTIGNDFPRFDESINLIDLLFNKFKIKDNFLDKPKYDLFKL